MHGTLYLVVGTPSERPSKYNSGQSGKFDEDYLTKPDYTVKETRSCGGIVWMTQFDVEGVF